MALVDEQLRFATAKAMIASDVIKISETEFIEKLEKSDVVIRAIIASLSQRLRAVDRLISETLSLFVVCLRPFGVNRSSYKLSHNRCFYPNLKQSLVF